LRRVLRLLRRVLGGVVRLLRLLRRVLRRVLRLLRRVLGGVDRGLGRDRLDRRSRLLLSRRIVGLVGTYSVLEAAQGLADRRPSVGQLSGADDDQDDYEQDD